MSERRSASSSHDPLMRFRSQERIDHGVLLRWTKGFGASNVEGHDVVAMLEKSLKKFVRSSRVLARRIPFLTPRSF